MSATAYSKFCQQCGAGLGADGAFCKGCGAQVALVPRPQASAAAPPPTLAKKAPWTLKETLVGVVLVAALLAALLALLLFVGKTQPNSKYGKVGRALWEVVPKFGNSLDGSYLNGEYDIALKIMIVGDRGSIDMGPWRAESMKVERRGDTVSLSGGTIFDAQGNVVEGSARNVLTGGDETNLFTLENDGLTLTANATDASGKRLVFTKQP